MIHSGSCLCGKNRFEVIGEFQNFYLCHCEHCKKDTGSAHAANLFSTTASLKWLVGGDEVVIYNYNNSGHIKAFCSVCGSAMPNLQMDGALLVVPAGSLDTEIPNTPDGHIFCSHKANWEDLARQIPTFEKLPD